MLLDIICLIFNYMGVMFTIIMPMIVQGTEFDFLPWPWLGAVFFLCGWGLVRYRGLSTTGWLLLDLPSREYKVGVTTEGPVIYLQKLYPSIAEYLKNKKDWYYHDNTEGAYSFGGHDARLIDSEVGYCADTTKTRFVNQVEQDFYDYDQMVDEVKKVMVSTKRKDNKFVLTGTETPLRVEDIDLEKNKFHKEVFEVIAEGYFIKVHGKTFSLKSFKRFQDKQAAPYQIGSIIHYVKALAAMKAARVKKGMGHIGMYVAIIVVVIIIIIVLALLMTGTIKMPSGFSL